MSSHTDVNFDARPHRRSRRARQRSGFAQWFAWVALAVAAGLGLTFVVQLGLFDGVAPKREVALAPVQKPNQITGGPSVISGFDKNKLPFEIKAERGEQDVKTESLVHLEQVKSAFARPSGATLTITSDGADYETKSKSLELVGNVVFAEGSRFRAHMDKAAVNMDDQTLTSQSPVSVDIIGGTITADTLSISPNGERILFKGSVHARFVTQKPASGVGE
jgi:LPS export ABC transporter protein LptC